MDLLTHQPESRSNTNPALTMSDLVISNMITSPPLSRSVELLFDNDLGTHGLSSLRMFFIVATRSQVA